MTVPAAKLRRMAEQIAANLAYSDERELVAKRVAGHLERFWDPRMKAALRRFAERSPADLSPTLREAVALLRD